VNYLLDTCVISELISRRPAEKVVRWVDSVPEDRVYLSVITLGEIKKGIEKLEESERKSTLAAWLEDELVPRFKSRLVPLDLDTLIEWGGLTARLDKMGRPIPAIDSLIAASALHGDFVLVTRNLSDFADTGVQLLNPWE
jgi:tRNA(fMet)-specific endonuclease VapC